MGGGCGGEGMGGYVVGYFGLFGVYVGVLEIFGLCCVGGCVGCWRFGVVGVV